MRSEVFSAIAPKIGCPIPQARLWIAIARENAARGQANAVATGIWNTAKRARTAKLICMIALPAIRTGVRRGARSLRRSFGPTPRSHNRVPSIPGSGSPTLPRPAPARYPVAMTGPIAHAYHDLVEEGRIASDPAQHAVLPALDRVLREAAEPAPRGLFGRRRPEPVRGLYLWGGVGRGKSMLMDLAVAQAGVPKRRVHFHAFMQEVHAGMHAARAKGGDDALAPVADAVARDVRLLAFDEMQVTDIADAMVVGRLFERLFAAGTAIVTTSNRPPRDLYKDGLNRAVFEPFIALIEDRMEVLELASRTDHRQGRLAGSPVWHVPADRAASKEMDCIFKALAPAAEPLTLRVKGRDVVLPAFGGGVARAPFWALCGAALGPADYLAIADAVRVLMIDGIPRLGRTNFNEAKRFVTLVDALYEARVRLVASAADLPESLYVEGEGSFEFARTASRLREMMSEGWGSA